MKLKYIVASGKSDAFGEALAYDTMLDAQEQLDLWTDVDKHPDVPSDDDWIDYIIAVPEKDAESAVNGHYVESEDFIAGLCGEGYHGRYKSIAGPLLEVWNELDD